MTAFFTRERFGKPQVLAGVLLLAFLAQCAWLVRCRLQEAQAQPSDVYRVERGLRYWQNRTSQTGRQTRDLTEFETGRTAANLTVADHVYDADHSPLWYLIASAPFVLWTNPLTPQGIQRLQWLAPLPYILLGALLGASVWYVARRLYGNAGGYIALTLYCFSPAVIRSSALWFAEPETGAAWGAFGSVFTAIAVAHTLYAPREVVLWNWRRILLLGLSFALAVGSQFSLIVLVPVALGLMLYVAPDRQSAATAIWVTAWIIGSLILLASYFFHPGAFAEGIRHASFFPISWRAFVMPQAYQEVVTNLHHASPALVFALPVTLITYVVWSRARYFGNTTPLVLAALFLSLRVSAPHYPGLAFQFVAIPLLFVFVAGVSADLLETRQRNLVLTCISGLLAANVMWNLWELVWAGHG
jgi:hypothetical protein